MRHTLREYLRQISDFLPWVPDWVFGIAAFAAIVAGGLALQGVITRLLRKRPANWHPFALQSWDKTRGLMRFIRSRDRVTWRTLLKSLVEYRV